MTSSLGDGSFEFLPNGNDQNLGRGSLALHERHVNVQVPVVQGLLNMLFDDVLDLVCGVEFQENLCRLSCSEESHARSFPEGFCAKIFP